MLRFLVLLTVPLVFGRRGKDFLGNLRWFTIPSFLGCLCNFLAVSLNGWQMPVMGVEYVTPRTLWKVANNPNVPWLVDRFFCRWGIYSVGDVFLCAGTLVIFLYLLYHYTFSKGE